MQIPLKVKGQSLDIVAGIDLGTTNTLVAQVVDGTPKVLTDRQGRAIVPSVVGIDEEHHAVVGDEAKARALMNPAGTITSVKRFMGRGLEDIDDRTDSNEISANFPNLGKTHFFLFYLYGPRGLGAP